MKERVLKEYFSIPNLMGYFRILLIPVYLFLYIRAETTEEYYMAAVVLLVSFLTDLFDGKIARRSRYGDGIWEDFGPCGR